MVFSILNMEFSDRVKERMKKLGISSVELAALVDVSKGSVTHWTNGTNQAGGKRLMALARVLKCNAEWLVSGKGPIEDDPGQSEDGSPSEAEYALIPQYSARGSCGDGYYNDHVQTSEGLVFKRDWLRRVGSKPENLFTIYANGDSMEPYIFEGDVVLFDTTQIEPRDKQVYVIRRPDGGTSIKRLIQQLNGSWIIRSDNPDKASNPDEPATETSIHDMPILGRVIWRGGGIG